MHLQFLVILLLAMDKVNALHLHQIDQSGEAFDEHSHYSEADILQDILYEREAVETQYNTRSRAAANGNGNKGSLIIQRSKETYMAITDNVKLWAGGVVPFVINFDPAEHVYVYDNIKTAMDILNQMNCVHFVEATNEADVLWISLGPDYSSHLGKQGGVQNLTVCEDNSNPGTVVHELMHSLGFGHEHNRPDRDNYIIIHWDNIKPEAQSYFKKYSNESGFTNHSLEYDYKSLMHATNQQNEDIFIDMTKPIISRTNGRTDVGQRLSLTELDQKRIKQTYMCGICDSAPEGFLFRFPGDCTKYYQCDHGSPASRNCNANLHFNDKDKYCDYPLEAHCTK